MVEGNNMNTELAPIGSGLTSVGSKIAQKDVNKHLDRYVFCLEDINLADRRLSVLKINRGRVARLTDISIADLDMSEEALTREGLSAQSDSDTQMTTIYTKSASDQALELYINYGERGLVVIESLTGQPPQTVRALEELLLAKVPNSLNEFKLLLSEVKLSADKAGQLASEVREEIYACIDKTIFYRSDVVSKSEGELASRSKPDGRGLNIVTSGMRFYAESLDHTLSADIARKPQDPIKIELPQTSIDPNQIAQIVAATLAAMKQAEAQEPEPTKKTK